MNQDHLIHQHVILPNHSKFVLIVIVLILNNNLINYSITQNPIHPIRDLAEGEMTKPEKGKKVSGEEFEKIRKEKMEEMGAVQGKGGTFKVMIREERN